MTSRITSRDVMTLAALLVPAVARAHLVNSGLGPFYDGVSHLAVTPDDLLPALAIALLAGQRGAGAGRATLFALPGAWLAGGLAGLAWPAAGSASWIAAIPLLALGGLVAAEVHLHPGVVVALAIGLGLTHGYLNGAAMAHARLGVLGLAGTVAMLGAVVALAAALVVAIRVPWGRIAVRVAGSWIAAIGLLALGWALRRG
jgi:hypothetical protein